MKFLTFPAIQLSERQQAKLNTQNKSFFVMTI